MLGVLFPRKCVFCASLVESKMDAIACDACGSLVRSKYRANRHFSAECIDDGMVALRYAGPVKAGIKRYKFRHNKGAAKYFAAHMAPLLAGQMDVWKPDLITFVPSSWQKIHTRGYNPAELLARELAGALKIPCIPLLRRHPFSKQQSVQSKEKRKQNAAKSFFLRKNVMVEGKNIVIADDVVTTGATLTACAGLLRGCGAGKIYAICAATASKR